MISFFRNKNFWFYLLITLIIAGGIFIRFWHLDTIPPGIHYDEAYNGINALNANQNHSWQIFYSDNTGREGLHINVEAIFIHFFGNTSLGLRLANALWGSLTIIGFFLLLRQLKFSRLSVIIGTFMIATSFWHLVFSRTAFRAIMVPLILVWMFYFFWKAIDASNIRHRIYYFIVSGSLLGLGFNTYIAFRIVPLIFILVVLSFAFTRKGFVKKYWKYGLALFIASLIAALPLFVYFSGHFKDFISRPLSVSVLNGSNANVFQTFLWSLGKHLWAFFVIGDHNPRHNYNNQPLLPAAWSVLFAIGFLISVKEIAKTIFVYLQNRKEKAEGKTIIFVTRWFYVSVLAQSIFWVMILPGALTYEGVPHSLRIIGTIPAVFIFCILPFEYIVSLFDKIEKPSSPEIKSSPRSRSITMLAGLIFMVVFGGISQVYIYFGLWANDLATMGAYERKIYDFGIMTRSLPLHQNNYLITAWNTAISQDRRQSSLKTLEYLAYPNIKQYTFYKPTEGFSQVSCDDPQIVLLESDQWLRNQYRGLCPDLKTKKYSYDNGKYIFWVISNSPS